MSDNTCKKCKCVIFSSLSIILCAFTPFAIIFFITLSKMTPFQNENVKCGNMLMSTIESISIRNIRHTPHKIYEMNTTFYDNVTTMIVPGTAEIPCLLSGTGGWFRRMNMFLNATLLSVQIDETDPFGEQIIDCHGNKMYFIGTNQDDTQLYGISIYTNDNMNMQMYDLIVHNSTTFHIYASNGTSREIIAIMSTNFKNNTYDVYNWLIDYETNVSNMLTQQPDPILIHNMILYMMDNFICTENTKCDDLMAASTAIGILWSIIVGGILLLYVIIYAISWINRAMTTQIITPPTNQQIESATENSNIENNSHVSEFSIMLS